MLNIRGKIILHYWGERMWGFGIGLCPKRVAEKARERNKGNDGVLRLGLKCRTDLNWGAKRKPQSRM